MTQTPLDPVAGHRVPDRLGDDEAHTRPAVHSVNGVVHRCCGQLRVCDAVAHARTTGPGGVHDERGPTGPDAAVRHGTELTGPMHPAAGRQHGRSQAESFARPLRRRAARMERPERVRIRERKPWLRARRRLLGWKVRFTGYSPLCFEDHPEVTAEPAALCPGRPDGRGGKSRQGRRLVNDTSPTPSGATRTEPILNHTGVVHSTRRSRTAMMAGVVPGARSQPGSSETGRDRPPLPCPVDNGVNNWERAARARDAGGTADNRSPTTATPTGDRMDTARASDRTRWRV